LYTKMVGIIKAKKKKKKKKKLFKNLF